MKLRKKMKVIPLCYKKRGSRDHSNSLSQLLKIGSYKKRINDLSINNRLLTTALQESLIEAASQNNLLKNYAKEANQILCARIKLNEMAKNLAKFATDLEEVRECLDVSLPSECNFFQEKKSSNERIIKVPDVSCIHEELELSENEATPYEETSDDVSLNDLEEDVASVNHDIEMTPILFGNDAQELQKKKSNGTYKGSLTPQLNIDFTYVNKRRSTRSRGKTSSLGKKNSKSGELVTHKKFESPPLIHEIQDSVEVKQVILESTVKVESIEKESENIKIPSENFSDESPGIGCDDYSAIQSSSFIIKDKESVLDIDSNPLSELREEICPLQSQNNENNSHFKADFEDNPEIHRNELEENRLSANDKVYPESNSKRLTSISQISSSSLHDMQLPEIHEYDEEIQNVGSLTFCESDDDNDENKNTVSPRIRSSRSKKPIKYSDYLLSDESDTDSPFKVAVKKKNGSKRIKLNSTPDSKVALTENVDEISSDAIKGTAEADYSIYNLDVSNSKNIRKKQKTKSKNKKVNDVSKPLLPRCSVTKLKGGNLKFSKFETTMQSKSLDTNTKISLPNSCVSPGGILKKVHPSPLLSCKNKNIEVPISEIGNIDNMTDGKQQNMLQTPRRVSFAPTDLVCKFEKMSESKAIADNKKVRRTSKSAFDLKELLEETDQLKASPKNIDNSFEITDAQKLNNSSENSSKTTEKIHAKNLNNCPKTSPKSTDISSERIEVQKLNNSVLFDFTADTEIYTLKLPLKAQFPILPPNDIASSKSPAPIVTEQTKLLISNDKCLEKSPRSPENTNKLSLKRNKISREIAPQVDFLFFESPMSLVKPPKRKSLFKELSDDCLKENINSDDLTLEEKDLLKKDPLNEVTCINKIPSLSTPSVSEKKSSSTKSQRKVHSKISSKKNKNSNRDIKSLEQSPVLTDATNIIAPTDEGRIRRRSKQISYKEPSLGKKLRRQ